MIPADGSTINVLVDGIALGHPTYNQLRPDVASLLPCNVVLREVAPERISVEIARPSAMMAFLDDPKLANMAEEADGRLARVFEHARSA